LALLLRDVGRGRYLVNYISSDGAGLDFFDFVLFRLLAGDVASGDSTSNRSR
jgi:hypothetical protein